MHVSPITLKYAVRKYHRKYASATILLAREPCCFSRAGAGTVCPRVA
jgi:hypothetical protein